MVNCSIHCCQQRDQKGSKSQCYALPKVKPLNDRKTVKAREGKLKAVISNKQRTAWLNVIKKGILRTNLVLKMTGTIVLTHACRLKLAKGLSANFTSFPNCP